MSEKPVVVVGGGIAGMLASLLLASKETRHPVILIEQSHELGGLLKSFDYGENGLFDYGVHNIQESLIPDLDELLIHVLPDTEWDILAEARRDIGGTFINGTLQSHTPYLDLRTLAEAQCRESMADFFFNLNHSDPKGLESANAYDYSVSRLGKVITETLIEPIQQKLFGYPMKALNRLPLIFFPFNRIAMFNEEIIGDLTQSETLRSRIGYTNQRQLPLERSSGKRSFYPKRFGMKRYVEALEAKLKSLGVSILKNTKMTALQFEVGHVKSLTLQAPDSETPSQLEIQELIWSAGVHSLASLLGQTRPEDVMDKPVKTAFAHLLLDQKLNVDDLFYFYCWDAGFRTYRVVNYWNFCSNAFRNGGYPVTLELFLPLEECQDKAKLRQVAVEELSRMGVMPAGTQVLFCEVEISDLGFPLPSMNNMELTTQRRERIQMLALENLTMIGALAEPDQFFQFQVVQDTYDKITQGVLQRLLCAKSLAC